MASVIKPKGQNIWNCRIKTWNAEKQTYTWGCWSTGKTTEKEAQEVASAYQRAAEHFYPTTPGRDDAALMKRVFRSMCERAGVHLDDFGDGPKFAYFAADWLKRRTDKTKESTTTAYTAAIEDFKAYLGEDGMTPMGQIDATRMQAYYDSIISDGRSTGTAKNKFVVIASIFKRAHELGSIRLNPCAPVETLEVVQEERKPFSAEQEAKIFHYLGVCENDRLSHVDWFTACMLSRWASLRLSDAANLKWAALTERNGHTIISYLPKKKTTKAGKGKMVVIPALGPLGAYLKSIPIAGTHLCPSLAGIPVGGNGGLSDQFADILVAAGIDRETIDRGEGGNDFSRLSYHSWRHTCTSNLMNLGVDEPTRMLLTDHESSSVHRRYSHSDAVKLAERLKNIIT